MSANPNPARVTGAMWRLWEESRAVNPGVKLGGSTSNPDTTQAAARTAPVITAWATSPPTGAGPPTKPT